MTTKVRKRVKDQQKRIFAAELRNPHFSYMIDIDGIESFVFVPELQSGNGTAPALSETQHSERLRLNCSDYIGTIHSLKHPIVG